MDAGGPVEPLIDGRRARRDDPDARAADAPPLRPRQRARHAAGALARHGGADPSGRARARGGRDRRDAGRATRFESAVSRSRRCTRRATPRGMLALLVNGRSSPATRCSRTRSAASARRAAPATRTCAVDHGQLMELPPETVVRRAHRPVDDRRGVREQRVRARLARARPRGRRAVHRVRRAGDARAARRRLRRRAQGLGALA